MKFAYLIEPPFNYRDAAGRVTGCDVEVARLVLGRIGIEPVELVEAEFAELLPGLADGRWQMTTGLFATEQRRRIAAFSRPIWALPDGLLVRRANPLALAGYRAVAGGGQARLGVVRNQVQHGTALGLGISAHQIEIFETYEAAARAVLTGVIDASASVARAHAAYIGLNPGLDLELVPVPVAERPPTYGAFAFALENDALRQSVDEALAAFLGSPEHRAMMAGFGFAGEEIDLICRTDP
jgi:polar amino acid transport system substrate-binding protein